MKSPKQQAQELAERVAESTIQYILSCPTIIDQGKVRGILLQELSLEQLIADKMMLDWLHKGSFKHNPECSFHFSWRSNSSNDIRLAITNAMKEEGEG